MARLPNFLVIIRSEKLSGKGQGRGGRGAKKRTFRFGKKNVSFPKVETFRFADYTWVSFQRIVNEKILRANSSEDKMLGDYFVNPSDGIITDKVLLNKILFYLWNDVCKDGEGDIFKVGETEDISFSELYGENGTKTLKKMMSYLGVTDPNGNKVTIENDAENTEL